MKESIIWYVALTVFGIVAASARYIHDLGKHDRAFTFTTWLASSTVGAIVAVFAGHACRAWELNQDLTYVAVGVAAISAKELMEVIPTALAKVVKRYGDKS